MQPKNELDVSPQHDELRLKIRSIREARLGSYEKAGGEIGFNKNTIASYEKGLTLPDIDFLFVFADRTGADLNELLRLRLAASRYETVRALVGAAQVDKPAPRAQPGVNVPVARHIVTNEAGEEIDVPSEIARLSLSSAWLAERGVLPANLVYTRMPDDSMSPTVSPGAVVVIDATTDTLRGDGIYAFHHGNALPIKRLQVKFDGGLWIRSDNPAYRDEELTREEASSLNILGKAIWSGGEM